MFKVAIIDDEPSVLEGLRIFIDWNKAGYEIVGEAADGKSALRLIMDKQPDLVICDIRMPGLTGLELIEQINQNMESVPKFIMLSGYNDFFYAQKALQLGAIGYMTKPLDSDELTSQLAQACEILESEKKSNQENLELIRYTANYLFNDIINGKQSEKLRRKVHFVFGIPENAKIRIVRFITVTDKKTKEFSHNRIYNWLIRITGIQNENCVFYNGNGSYIIIFHEGMHDFPHHKMLLERFNTQLCRLNRDELGLQAYWALISGISGSDTLDNMCRCSKQLDQLHTYCMMHPKNTVVCYEELNRSAIFRNQCSAEVGAILPEILYDRIINAIKGNNPSAVSTSVEEFFNEMTQTITTDFLRYVCLYRLADVVRKLASTYEIEASQAILDFTASVSSRNPNCRNLALAMCDQVFQKLNKNNDKSLVLLENEIIDYIKSNFRRKNLSIQHIAEDFSLPAMIISKIIKKITGQKFNDYVNYLRIEYAKTLLASENMKITAVCDESGYGDYGYFTKKFKEFSGILPSEYKKKYS